MSIPGIKSIHFCWHHKFYNAAVDAQYLFNNVRGCQKCMYFLVFCSFCVLLFLCLFLINVCVPLSLSVSVPHSVLYVVLLDLILLITYMYSTSLLILCMPLSLSLCPFSLSPSRPPAGVAVSESYSFVLTNIAGKRRFGYCRRLLVKCIYETRKLCRHECVQV